MRKPNKPSKDSLRHPKSKGTEYKRFNGETAIRGDRWNGAADWDEPGGFNNRVHTVVGTTPQSNCRERQNPVPAPPMSRTYVPLNPDIFNRPAMSVEENKRPQIIEPGASK